MYTPFIGVKPAITCNLPFTFDLQGQGRIEKTEIIEMAIRHIKNLTNKTNTQGGKQKSLLLT
jgi:hypothetical protein